MSKYTQRLKDLIDRGRSGENSGLSIGLPRLEEVIDPLSKSTYYLIAGSTGSGKTTQVLYSFVYKPYLDAISKGKKILIIYFSLEMSVEELLGKIVGMYLFEKYGVEISYKELISRKKGYRLSDEYYDLVVKDGLKFSSEIEESMIILESRYNADSLKNKLYEILSGIGRFNGDNTLYMPNDPDLLVEVIIDHIGLLSIRPGSTRKKETDDASSNLIYFRNICKIAVTVLMQLNRGSSDTERRKLGQQEIQLNDLKDSGNPSEDANIVLALFYPYREKMKSYRKYKDIEPIGDIFRAILCLKNRFGESGVSLGVALYGKVGIVKELPKGDEITDYEQYTTPFWDNKKIENENINYNITL